MDFDWQDVVVTRFLGPIVRHYAGAFIVLLTAHGFTFDAALADDFTKAALYLIPVVALSIWQKVRASRLLQKALDAPAGTPKAAL